MRFLRSSLLRKHRCSVPIVPPNDAIPDLVRALGVPEKLPIFFVDDTFSHEKVHINGTPPAGFTHLHNGDRIDLAGLYQGEGFEEFIQGAVSA